MFIREALFRFYALHEEYKSGKLQSREALASYSTEREAFMTAFVQAQQLALRPGQSPRQSLRVTRTERLSLSIGQRVETTFTLDIGVAGFSALVGPLAVRIACEFEMGTAPEVARGRARVVASVPLPDGTCRTSFAIDMMPDGDRARLENWVVDAALQALAPKR
jgi:hypothetical protein